MRGLAPFWIEPQDTTFHFPDVSLALHEPDGLLAVGGDLSPQRLQAAYRQGIFPWYNHDQPILWWAPNPRAVLFPQRLKISRSLRKTLRKGHFRVTADKAFTDVIEACSGPRLNNIDKKEHGSNEISESGTWITPEMKQAYQRLHEIGVAHSVECWQNEKLVGGLYGVALGQVFFGESMFTRVTDASKVAFVHLVKQLTQWDFKLIDCQIYSTHLESLGAESISREEFTHLLDQYCEAPGKPGPWQMMEVEELLDSVPQKKNPRHTKQTDPPPPKQSLENLAFFASISHDCGYLPDRSSVSLFADPEANMDMENFSALLEHGFRRSGTHVYRPHCPTCRACLAARIPVEDFKPNRAQARTWRKNTRQKTEIIATVMEPAFRKDQFALYRKYISARHSGGGMDNPSPNKYMEFLTSPWTQTEFVEFRLNGALMAVAIMDVLSCGLSSVYTFFDPNHAGLSLGRHALLWQIKETQRRRLPHLYLGYWINNCQKMFYKQEYRPIELYQDNRWLYFDRNEELAAISDPKNRSSVS